MSVLEFAGGRLPQRIHIRLVASLHLAGYDQPIRRVAGHQFPACGQQVLDALVGLDSPEAEHGLLFVPDAQSPLRLLRGQIRVRKSVVDRMPDHGHRLLGNAEILDQLISHLAGVNEDMVAQPVLHSEREPVEPRIIAVPLPLIHIVRGESDLFSQHPVIEHQQSAVEELDLAVPQDMKHGRPRQSGIAHQRRVMSQDAPQFGGQRRPGPGWRPEIEKAEMGRGVHLRAVHLVAADDIQANALQDQGSGQAERVRPVDSARQQRGLQPGWRCRAHGLRGDFFSEG